MSTELVEASPRPSSFLKPIESLAHILEGQKQVAKFVKSVLVEGRDYGNIPGTDKPALLKPGAEVIIKGFGCRIEYDIIEKEVDHVVKFPWKKQRWNKYKKAYEFQEGESYGFYRYVVKARLLGPEGQQVAECIGMCSTMESKYVDRPRDCENTVLKMAQKRAKVGVTIEGFGLSNQFTQDLEDDEGDKADVGDAARTKVSGFSPTDGVQVKWLEDQLVKLKVSKEEWPSIKEEMTGKTSDKLAEVIKQVCGNKE